MSADFVHKRSYLLPNMKAFTLIEVMVILAILTFLLFFIVPAGREFLVEHRTITGANRIVGGLYLARIEAVQRNEKIIFCQSTDGNSCGGKWNDGQIIIDSKGKLLRKIMGLPKGDTLIWNSSGGRDDRVEWLPSGFTNGQRGTFYYCAGSFSAVYSQAIVLLNTGRIYVSLMDPQDYGKYCPQK
jgi:type IV fimbrial biogenesis protein FimT